MCEVQVSSKGPLDFMGSRNTEGIFTCVRTVGEREKLRQGQPRAERERGCEATRRARVRGGGFMSRTGRTWEIVTPISIVAGATGMGPIEVRRAADGMAGRWEGLRLRISECGEQALSAKAAGAFGFGKRMPHCTGHETNRLFCC